MKTKDSYNIPNLVLKPEDISKIDYSIYNSGDTFKINIELVQSNFDMQEENSLFDRINDFIISIRKSNLK